jgi:transposase
MGIVKPPNKEVSMRKQYHVKLTDEERIYLSDVTNKGKAGARRIKRARILLMADAEKPDREIIAAVEVAESTVGRTRQRFAEGGIDRALNDNPRPGRRRLLDGKQEAFLVALTCSDSPEGQETWTMQLLADKLVELKVVERISDETVRQTLKKTSLSRGNRSVGASRK